MLTASEIAEYTFCPQAWHLRRQRLPRGAAAELRLEAGSVAHRRIGRQTDALRYVDRTRRLLLLVVLVVAILLTTQLMGRLTYP